MFDIDYNKIITMNRGDSFEASQVCTGYRCVVLCLKFDSLILLYRLGMGRIRSARIIPYGMDSTGHILQILHLLHDSRDIHYRVSDSQYNRLYLGHTNIR